MHDDDREAANVDLAAKVEQAWTAVREIIDTIAKAQRGFLRRRIMRVRLDQAAMDTISIWAADYIIPADEIEVILETKFDVDYQAVLNEALVTIDECDAVIIEDTDWA